MGEGTAPGTGPASAVDVLYADSTQHGFLANFNNAGYLPLVQGPASGVSGDLASLSGTNGGKIVDAGFLATNVVRKDTTNSGAAAMTLDMSASTVASALKIPVKAGVSTAVNGSIGYDSTTDMLHAAQAGADAEIPQTTVTPSNNDCVTWVVSGSKYKLGTAGAGCGSGGATGTAVTNRTPVTANTNSTSAQALMELSLGAGYFNSSGQPFLFNAAGLYTTQAAQTPTITLTTKLCTVSGCGSGTVVTLASIVSTATIAAVTNNNWNLSFVGYNTATGATGNLEVHGFISADLGALTSTADSIFNDLNTAVSSNIDLTAALYVDFFVTFSTNAAGPNTFTQRVAGIMPFAATAAPVTSFTGDGALISNSSSTGAITTTLATAGAHKVWMNNTGSTAAPGYQSIGTADLPALPHQYGGAFGTPGGSAISTGLLQYAVVQQACTIVGYDILVDAGTATVKFWKIATGTAIPTVANVINTSGLSISTGTALRSSTTSDFTTTTVTAGDIIAVTDTAVSGAGYIYATFRCQ